MRKIIADILALVLFSTVIGMAIEILISGMTIEQSIHARLVAIPLNLLSGRPQALFRDWILRVLGVNKQRNIRKIFGDIVSFTVFQVCLYAIILCFSGATVTQIICACKVLALTSLFIAKIYGWVLEYVRTLFKIKNKSATY